ncbi:MAG: HIT domain-containing protein [Candidatus Dojkabacteria bacterium]
MEDTVFHKIIRKEIPATIRYEDEHVLAFNDINPQGKTHVLLIPKVHITDLEDAVTSDEKMRALNHLIKALPGIARETGVTQGYTVQTNVGDYQEVPYLHFHIISKY